MVGNNPNYDDIDVLRCFYSLSDNPSRQSLVDSLKLGEGTVRTILDIFKEKKLTQSTKAGHSFTKKGETLLKKLIFIMHLPKSIDIREIEKGAKKVSVLLHKSDKVDIDYKLRDAAVKKGADGALIFKFDKDLFLPNSKYKGDFSYIEKQFSMSDDNILIVGFAKKSEVAERGAIAVALEMSSALRKILASLK